MSSVTAAAIRSCSEDGGHPRRLLFFIIIPPSRNENRRKNTTEGTVMGFRLLFYFVQTYWPPSGRTRRKVIGTFAYIVWSVFCRHCFTPLTARPATTYVVTRTAEKKKNTIKPNGILSDSYRFWFPSPETRARFFSLSLFFFLLRSYRTGLVLPAAAYSYDIIDTPNDRIEQHPFRVLHGVLKSCARLYFLLGGRKYFILTRLIEFVFFSSKF